MLGLAARQRDEVHLLVKPYMFDGMHMWVGGWVGGGYD